MTDLRPPTCGILAACGRAAGHGGHCGGYTKVEAIPADAVVMPGELTPRQVQVLIALATGETRGYAAESLSMSEATLDNHLTAAFSRLGVISLLEAYRKLGWLRIRRTA